MHPLQQAWETLKHDFDVACSQRARAAREASTSQLNQLLRRLRQYKEEGEWVAILADSAACFARQVAVFEVQANQLKLRSERGLDLTPESVMPIAPAMANAIQTKDPVLALRTISEVGEALSVEQGRARVLPVTNGDRVAALLFVSDEEDADPNALELITGIASTVLERRVNAEAPSRIGISSVAKEKAARPAWGDLSEAEQTLHLRAQRFARVAVAEAQLSRPEACAAARESGDVYLYLKPEIEKAREAYRKQFMVVPSMVDYLHLEIVRVIADTDERMLGVEYPGALV